MNNQPKLLKTNLKKFRLDRESLPDLCDDRTQLSVLTPLHNSKRHLTFFFSVRTLAFSFLFLGLPVVLVFCPALGRFVLDLWARAVTMLHEFSTAGWSPWVISSAGLSPVSKYLHVSASGAVSMVTHDRVDLGCLIPHERLAVGVRLVG